VLQSPVHPLATPLSPPLTSTINEKFLPPFFDAPSFWRLGAIAPDPPRGHCELVYFCRSQIAFMRLTHKRSFPRRPILMIRKIRIHNTQCLVIKLLKFQPSLQTSLFKFVLRRPSESYHLEAGWSPNASVLRRSVKLKAVDARGSVM
jgi:hypothetical protein